MPLFPGSATQRRSTGKDGMRPKRDFSAVDASCGKSDPAHQEKTGDTPDPPALNGYVQEKLTPADASKAAGSDSDM